MKFFWKRRGQNKGSTLFEILTAIVLLGLAAVFLILVVPSQLKKARDGKRKADLEKIKVTLYDYFFDQECFPENLPDCGEELRRGNTVYLASFPCDPNGGGYGYQTREGECSNWFKILAGLENTNDKNIDKVGCGFGCGAECEYNYGLSSSNIRVNEGCARYYACSPGGGGDGVCDEYDDPGASECPSVFENDPTCQNFCQDSAFRCKNASGKHVPD